MNSFNATTTTVNSFLSAEKKKIIIPKFQREYTWGKVQWEELFNDLIDHEAGYFLGNILVIEDKKSDEDFDTYEIIDGQQRLTTLSIFVLALYSSFKQLQIELNKEGKLINDRIVDSFRTLSHMIVDINLPEEGNESVKLRLQKQNNNDNDYYWLLSDNGLINFNTKPRNFGNRRIHRAYKFFYDHIQSLLEENENKLEILKDLRSKLVNAILIVITVGTFSDAHSIFESINNRGIPLTSVDLLKNILLSELDSNSKDQNDYYYDQWLELINNLGEDYSSQERFLRHYYNGFRGEINRKFTSEKNKYPLGARATRSTIISNFEPLIKKEPKETLDDLVKTSRIYSKLLLKNPDELSDSLKRTLENLQNVNGIASYQLLLYLFKNQQKLSLSEEELTKIIDLLVKFFVRRHLTDVPPTRDIDRLFISIIDNIEDKELIGKEIVNYIIKRIRSVAADNDLFKAKLNSPIYLDNSGITRFILCSIAEEGMTRENRINLWEKFKSNQYIWTIEHIFPQGENIPVEWVEMIAGGDRRKAEEYQDQYVHQLGNLTISAYNSNLGNKSFIEKRDRTNKEGKYIGFKNGLNLNHDLAQIEEWTIEDIKDRTNHLIRIALEKFSL